MRAPAWGLSGGVMTGTYQQPCVNTGLHTLCDPAWSSCCGCMTQKSRGCCWQEEEQDEDEVLGSDSEASGFVVPDDHLSDDEGIHNAQRDLDGLCATMQGELTHTGRSGRYERCLHCAVRSNLE